MTNPEKGLVVLYGIEENCLKVFECENFIRPSENPILSFNIRPDQDDMSQVEITLGQFVLSNLDRITPGGLGIPGYSDLFDRISDENFEVFCAGLDSNLPEDQYDLAMMIFNRGRRKKSWTMIQESIRLFESSSSAGCQQATHFLVEVLPIVLPRLQEKLQSKEGDL